MKSDCGLCSICICGLILGTAAGCQPELYRGETTVNSDGSVERAIYQPLETTPLEASRSELWAKTTGAPRIEMEKWTGSITALPIHDDGHAQPYFAAWGRFPDALKIPSHFVRVAPEGLSDGRLSIETSRIDYGFVIEHRWRETLTDIVTLDDMHEARGELTKLFIGLGEAAFNNVFGRLYDASRLIQWLETEGTAWSNEATDLLYDLGMRGELKGNGGAFQELLARICKRHGLDMYDATGSLLAGEVLQQAISDFALNLVHEKARLKDGSPIPDDVLEAVFKDFFGDDADQEFEQPDEKPRKSLLHTAFEKHAHRKFGDAEKFEAHVEILVLRIVGLHCSRIIGPTSKFHYRVKLPGAVTQTTGRMIAADEVEWSFEEIEAFPRGYVMEARSLELVKESQRKLLPGGTLETRESQIRFVDHLTGYDELRKAVVRCVAKQSMKPLYDYRAEADNEEWAHALKLVLMLRLPAKAPRAMTPERTTESTSAKRD